MGHVTGNMAARGACRRAGQDSEPKPEPGPEPEPGPAAALESGEEFEIVDRSQLPSPGELRSAARHGWSAPILTLARRATGNLSASCGSALRAAAGLADGGGGGERAGRPGSLGPGLLRRPVPRGAGALPTVPPGGRSAGQGGCGPGLPSLLRVSLRSPGQRHGDHGLTLNRRTK